jgi:hypothetical protein
MPANSASRTSPALPGYASKAAAKPKIAAAKNHMAEDCFEKMKRDMKAYLWFAF